MAEVEKAGQLPMAEKLGRHEIIFGRYTENSDLILSGFMHSQFENQRNTEIGQVCPQSQHLSAAKRALPDANKGKFPEAAKDPALGPVDEKTNTKAATS